MHQHRTLKLPTILPPNRFCSSRDWSGRHKALQRCLRSRPIRSGDGVREEGDQHLLQLIVVAQVVVAAAKKRRLKLPDQQQQQQGVFVFFSMFQWVLSIPSFQEQTNSGLIEERRKSNAIKGSSVSPMSALWLVPQLACWVV
ncbi:hypothetical protein LOK49_LG04G03792 [Camellia lanceoleosa]|uniref:Uncharacterized protein n=1 Tax=Camellia lanceoleosa TaxID=1840588 RepID=A0ACC0HYA7_9ERIC|nr:hypothetical protein LOK49_LG04G03792 [Camellia lanceoleosa]